MRIGGWIVAGWAVTAWAMLISGGSIGLFAAACVLVQAVIEARTLARHVALLAGTIVFVGAASGAAYFLGSPPAIIAAAAARLIAVVLVAPLAGEHASSFWLCRILQKAHLPRHFMLAMISSFSVFPVLIENLTTLIYHHRRLRGSRRVGLAALTATMVMTLDRVQDMEIADNSFDIRALLARAPGLPIAPRELIYAAQLVIMAIGAAKVV